MNLWHRRVLAIACVAAALTAALAVPRAADAQIGRGDLVITISESIDPAPSGADVAYGIAIKNTGSIRAKNVLVTIPMPSGTTFVKCTTVPSAPIGPCKLANGVVTAKFLSIAAHGTSKVNLTLKMPVVTSQTTISLFVDANGDQVNDNSMTITTTVLGTGTLATYLPSGRQVTLNCGFEANDAAFGADTTLRLDAGMGCASSPVGIRMAASGKTLDLNLKKIVGPQSGAAAKGSVGVVIAAGKTNVTVRGGGTPGTAGVEYFDWCIADEGFNINLSILSVRCFRARSAGLDLASDNVSVTSVLVDKAVGTSTTTFDMPGGVGLRVTGDNVTIHNTKVRRTGRIGLWASGSDTDANGVGISMTGNTTSSRIEDFAGAGILADGQKLKVKDTMVMGDGTLATSGVVVEATAVGTVLDGVVVREIVGNGFVVAGASTQLVHTRAENVTADGYVITGAFANMNGNESRADRHGYVLGGPDAVVTTNLAENVGGDGFVVDGERVSLASNSAKSGVGHGFVVNGAQADFDTNLAELNDGDGYRISGTGGTYDNNRAKSSLGIGYRVLGSSNTFRTNLAENSASGVEWSIAANNIDGGGNKCDGAVFTFGPTGGSCP